MSPILDSLQDRVGQPLGTSSWVTVGQDRIDAFAACTEDHQWIHTDPERAAQSPLGGTIAHGYLTLSLLPKMTAEVGLVPDGVASALNYGSDKVRFLAPVPSGARVRAHVELVSAVEKRPGEILLTTRSTVEIEGSETPALVADTLALLLTDPS